MRNEIRGEEGYCDSDGSYDEELKYMHVLNLFLVFFSTVGIVSNIIDYRRKSKTGRSINKINRHFYKIGKILSKMCRPARMRKTEKKILKSYLKGRKIK